MMLQVITTCVFYIQKCFNFRNLLNYNMNDIPNTENTLGDYIKNKLLTVFRFIGLK